MSILNKLFPDKKKKKPYKNPKGNNSTRIPVKYEELKKRIKKLRDKGE